ncbi:uncharacterized protein LOC124898080 [Capsicum annuum]|uniref:uncharacterized protein LOC124898080 n=1 Tax=Capsicum annuum TaxID=4072 RepID=UPI001FB145D7|nr:uncharacterized protein LOC124898080 [Capsicum annuum]
MDVSHKEQRVLVLRYVNKEGKLIERFLSVVHVKDTSARSLKDAIYSFILEHNLSSSHICRQGYDGASNMQGELNDLKILIMKDTRSTYSSRKKLRDDQTEKLEELLMFGEVHTGSELNQELGLQRAGDTHWSSHFKTVHNFMILFSSIIHVLGVLVKEGSNYQEKSLAKSLEDDIRFYEFVYTLHLMLKVLTIIHDLNMALQKKVQDIVTAMNLVGFTKRRLQSMRDSKWGSLVKDVSLFVPNMIL